jgi:hypothetical protein
VNLSELLCVTKKVKEELTLRDTEEHRVTQRIRYKKRRRIASFLFMNPHEHPLPLRGCPPIFVPPDNYRFLRSLTYLEDFKNVVYLNVWWTKGGRSPTEVHQTRTFFIAIKFNE